MPSVPPYIAELANSRPDKYTFTKHAVSRYVERASKLNMGIPKKPEKTLQRLISNAGVEETSPTHRAVRLINNNYRDVTYLVRDGWRFVVSDDGKTVITVERVDPTQN